MQKLSIILFIYRCSILLPVTFKSKNTLAILTGLALVASLAYAPTAFAEHGSGLTIEADAVEGATTITIHGHTDSGSSPVIIKVLAPNGNLVSIDQLNVSAGEFEATIATGGPLWKQDGIYTIEAQQGSASQYKSSVDVEIADGAVVPEFGTIASLVLVVAITSIVILSAKGRLSFTPRI